MVDVLTCVATVGRLTIVSLILVAILLTLCASRFSIAVARTASRVTNVENKHEERHDVRYVSQSTVSQFLVVSDLHKKNERMGV